MGLIFKTIFLCLQNNMQSLRFYFADALRKRKGLLDKIDMQFMSQ